MAAPLKLYVVTSNKFPFVAFRDIFTNKRDAYRELKEALEAAAPDETISVKIYSVEDTLVSRRGELNEDS